MPRLLTLLVVGALLVTRPLPSRAAGGDVLWNTSVDVDGEDSLYYYAATDGRSVFVAGRSQINPGPIDYDGAVRVFDAKTGAFVWGDTQDFGGADDLIYSVAAARGRVLLAGTGGDDATDTNLIVRMHDAALGTLLWSDTVDLGLDDGSGVSAAVLAGSRAFVRGTVGTDGNLDLFLRAYDAKTGTVLWTDQFDFAGGNDRQGSITTLGSRLFRIGTVTNPLPTPHKEGIVRAYDAKTGTLLWQQVIAPPSPWTDVDTLTVFHGGNVVASHGQVSVAVSHTDGTNTSAAVYAFDAKVGAPLWNAELPPAPGTVGVRGMGRSGKTTLLLTNPYLLRAYDATGVELWTASEPSIMGAIDSTPATFAVRGNIALVGGWVNFGPSDTETLVHAVDVRTGAALWTAVGDRTDAAGFNATLRLPATGSTVFALATGTGFRVQAYDLK